MPTVGAGVRFFTLMHAIQSLSDIAKCHETYYLEKANVLMLMSTLSHPTVAKKKIDKKIQIGHFRVKKLTFKTRLSAHTFLFALSLALKERLGETRKWTISDSKILRNN